MKIFYVVQSLTRYVISKLTTRQSSSFQPPRIEEQHEQNQNQKKVFPRVSVIIPTRDKANLLRNCIDSVLRTTNGLDVEVIVMDNDSKQTPTIELFTELSSAGIRIIQFPGKFNFSAICNFAVNQSTGDVLCFLNNDTEAISNNWLESMMEHALRVDVGLVGAVLLCENRSIQHMGVALGYKGVAGHPFQGESLDDWVPKYCYEVSAVTFACAVISREKFESIGGLDPKFPVGFNDVDFAIRSQSKNLKNVVCTKAVLRHFESQTRPRSTTISGFPQALGDVIRLTAKHPGKLIERFF